MKKEIIIVVIISLMICVGVLCIPKHEVPTEKEWKAYLEEINSSKQFLLDGSSCSPVQ